MRPSPCWIRVEIGDALRVDVANDLRDAERQLPLLLGFALREQLADAADDLGVRRARAQRPTRCARPASRDEAASSARSRRSSAASERRVDFDGAATGEPVIARGCAAVARRRRRLRLLAPQERSRTIRSAP